MVLYIMSDLTKGYIRIVDHLIKKINFYNLRHSSYSSQIVSYIREYLSDYENIRILDIGAGKGEVISNVKQQLNSIIVALDTLPPPFNFVRSINFVVGDVRFLPFKDGVFNLVTMVSLIEHLTDPQNCIRESGRVIIDRGINIIQFPNFQWFIEAHTFWPFLFITPNFFKRIIVQKSGYRTTHAVGKRAIDFFYLRFDVTLNNVIRWFKENEFTVLSIGKDFYNVKLFQRFLWPPSWFLVFQKKSIKR